MGKLKISLAAARVNAKMTKDDVAKKLKVSNKTVGNWEKGLAEPSLATLYALCSIYGVHEDDIFLPTKST